MYSTRLFWIPAVLLAGCGGSKEAALTCEAAAFDALRGCVAEVGEDLYQCHAGGEGACRTAESTLRTLGDTVSGACDDGDIAGLTVDAAVERLEVACSSQAEAVGWRFYGGPHDGVWSEASSAERSCLGAAHTAANAYLDESMSEIAACHGSAGCDETELAATRSELATRAAAELDASCPSGIQNLVSLDSTALVDRIAVQAACLASTALGETGPLGLECGPGHAQFDGTRGEWTEVVVDGAEWGTLCGDGSDYAFWVRLAPEGQPLDRIFIGLEGGGVCLFEDDCAPKFQAAPELFTALDGRPEGAGIASLEPGISEFSDWTQVYLPYCNQDVFAGGGVTEDLGSLQLPRHGSVNLRSALRMVRDVVWRDMDAAGGPGFRPDQLTALFGGWSAGSYGTLYNYPFLLDELLWPRSIAFPDAGLALHNGELLGVRNLGLVKIPAWNMGPFLPPYCFDTECAEGPYLLRKASPRLLQVPQQQMLLLTNPRDQVQQADAFFSDEAFWINTLRREVCDHRDLPGVHFYLTSVADESVHVVTIRDELWLGAVDGVEMRDWFSRAVSDPSSVTDRMEEGDFVTAVPGVEPFPCSVAP